MHLRSINFYKNWLQPATQMKRTWLFFMTMHKMFMVGSGLHGRIWVSMSREKIVSRIMKECFRNTKEIVEFSFNILTGKQSNFKERVSTRTFADVNFLKQNDMILEKENYFEVKFSKRTFMKPYLKSFSNRAEEKEWVSNQIVYSIYKEQVRPQDILILFNQEKDFEDLDNLIKSKDTANKILGFIKPYGDETNNDKDRYIFKENHLTISTIKGAKGYDTYCVFLVGLDTFTLNNQSRASFYVGLRGPN